MGRAAVRAGTETPPCPKCGGKNSAALASDQEHARYQCGNSSCAGYLDVFIVPGARGRSLPTPDPERESLPAAARDGESDEKPKGDLPEEESMAKLKCGKCDRTFTHQAWFEKHEESCGEPAAAQAKPAKRAAPSSRAAALSERLQKERPPAELALEREPLVLVDAASLAPPSVRMEALQLLRRRLGEAEATAKECRELLELLGESADVGGGG